MTTNDDVVVIGTPLLITVFPSLATLIVKDCSIIIEYVIDGATCNVTYMDTICNCAAALFNFLETYALCIVSICVFLRVHCGM